MPGPASHRGPAGEHATAAYLAARGHTIVERNWRGRGGELDLITLHDGILHFVEVKTRSGSESVGGVWDSISASKRSKLVRTAEAYLLEPPPHDACVFSVALVTDDGGELAIEFLPNAFDSTR
jgi:putative endonuclease